MTDSVRKTLLSLQELCLEFLKGVMQWSNIMITEMNLYAQ